MSKIEKLQIQGIRSFGNEPAAINLFSPLTLIVGYNGSGKTTIIECLKFATTGEQPPNSKGGAFIHDPKLTGERDQWAQVKVQFKASTGARMVVTRNLLLTIQRAKRQQKTMECSLMTKSKDGERTTVSSRVAELDAILPQYLGVSKAILENVIFCHQDDSLWPMSEPGNLKKKFDAIFEAQKYTKAIENIKQLRKSMMEKLTSLKLTEQYAKEDKDKSDKAKRKSSNISDEIEELRAETEELRNRAQEAGQNAQEAWNKASKFTEIVEMLKVRRQQHEMLSKNAEELLQRLEELRDSDEELDEILQAYDQRLESCRLREVQTRQDYELISEEVKEVRAAQNAKKIEAGRLQEQLRSHERRTRTREDLVRDAARVHLIRGTEDNLDDAAITEFIDRLSKIGSERTSHAEKVQQENASEMREIQSALDAILVKRSTALQTRKSLKENIDKNDTKMKVMQKSTLSLAESTAEIEKLKGSIENIEKNLETARREQQEAETADKSSSVPQRLAELESRLESFTSELVKSTAASSQMARVDHLRKEIRDKKRSIEVTLSSHQQQLQGVIGEDFTTHDLAVRSRKAYEEQKEQVSNSSSVKAKHEKHLEQIRYRLRLLKDEVQQRNDQVKTFAQQIRDATEGGEPEEYLEILEDLQANRNTRADDVKSFEVLKRWYNDCIATARGDNPACRLCKRAFDDQHVIDRFVANLERQVSSGTLQRLQKELNELEKSLRMARSVQSKYDQWQRIGKEDLPSLKSTIKELDTEQDRFVGKLDEVDATVSAQQDSLQAAEHAVEIASMVTRINNEVENIGRQLQDLLEAEPQNKNVRGPLEIQAEMDDANSEIRDLRSQQAKSQASDQSRRERIAQLEISRSEARNRLITASANHEKIASTISQVEELKQANAEHRQALEALARQLEELESQRSSEETRLSASQQKGRDRETQLQNEARQITSALTEIIRVHQEIRNFVESGGMSKIDECDREMHTLDDRAMTLEKRLLETGKDIESIQREVIGEDKIRRDIQDNLAYRKGQRELAANAAEIENLERQNAEADQEHHRKQYERWQKTFDLVTMERSSKLGAMKEKDDQLVQLLHEWQVDFKDAALKYKRAHIEVETTKAAIEDLSRYGSALDQAIMRFHSLKMEEINRIIEELWRRTYQGTDVDRIMIRSDSETARGNRSYNYRVCMVKQDVEMDMRGRCSAGQRVLASIIIRLALAECFGVNCGLIALDEPTTNLDRDNIRSLAESLHDIINARRGQSNFQLIVITHDEEFLRYMRCSDFCENYFRVQRNDRQDSEIWRNSITEVM